MKGQMEAGAIIVVIAVAILLVLVFFPDIFSGPLAIGDQAMCQDRFSIFASYKCCDDVKTESGSQTLSFTLIFRDPNQLWLCPTDAFECDVTPVRGITQESPAMLRGSTNCGYEGLFGEFWICSNDQPISYNVVTTVPGGTYIHLAEAGNARIDYEIRSPRLCECGPSPCGEPCPKVLGSDGCGFTTTDTVYDENGARIIDSDFGFAYTVPNGDCYTSFPDTNRRVIGNTCEDCENTDDCKSRFSLSFNYLGTEYGATCGSGFVNLHDCLDTGPETCIEERFDKDNIKVGCNEFAATSRCDQFLNIPVQCCPGTNDCGANAFCDASTFTCKDDTQCVGNTDCGTTVQCDFADKTINTPVCISGICEFDERDVDCCIDGHCPSGFFCSADFTCKERTGADKVCPFACCEDEQGFIDRPCAGSQVCCATGEGNQCLDSCDEPPVDVGFNFIIFAILIIIISTVIIGVITESELGLIAGFILGLIIVYLIWLAIPVISQIIADLGGVFV